MNYFSSEVKNVVGNYILHFCILFGFTVICVGLCEQSFPQATDKIEGCGPTLIGFEKSQFIMTYYRKLFITTSSIKLAIRKHEFLLLYELIKNYC